MLVNVVCGHFSIFINYYILPIQIHYYFEKEIMKYLFLLLTGLFLVSSNFANAQNGIIRGNVIDGENGEPLIGVTVLVVGTQTGSATDLDGAFQINLAPGTYTLQVSFISYETVNIEDVQVVADEVTLLENIRLTEATTELQEVVVTAEVIQTSEAAILTVKRKSANVLDGISSQTFRQIGDGDAAAAIKRVPGVSVEGGKYVYVRGLGDRYTKSILNGVDIPGLDPDRNTLQMDIFPTNVIDNIIVKKSFTGDLPADFTGGIVDIQLKDFPEERNISISGSLGYNPNMHFKSNYLTYEGGNTDWLGFDDGTRDIPTDGRTDIPFFTDVVGRPNSPAGLEYRSILEGFNPTLAAMEANSGMNYSVGFSYGDQFDLGKSQLGLNFALTYKNTTEFYEDAQYGVFGKPRDKSETELQRRELQTGDFGVNDVLLGGLAGIALKTNRSKFRLNVLHLQNGTSKAGIFDVNISNLGTSFTAIQHNLEYSERSLTNILLAGEHTTNDNNWDIEWKISPTRSKIYDPDIRFTRYRTDGGNFTVGTESGIPERIWRDLEEDNFVGKIDITRRYSFGGRDAKFLFGGSYTYKQRDYNIQNFQIRPRGVELTGDPNELFRPENLWPTDDGGSEGTTYDPLFIPVNVNQFDSQITNAAAYFSNEANLSENLKTIIGLRMEKYEQLYTGQNQSGDEFNDLQVLDDLDFFPTVNLIYSIGENMNIRASYARTIARPSFKEASFATILDPITGRTFIGGFFPDVDVNTGEEVWDGNLTKTIIQNFDLRWELFQERGQTFSVSAFYKQFQDPIEIVQYIQARNNFQPRNVGDGRVLGFEVEARKNLSFIAPALDRMMFVTNVTIIDSQIDMSATELRSRENTAREGEVIDPTREMAGQAPYIVNAGLQYQGIENGLELGVYYNVQGETLLFVGVADRPDIFSVPFHNLKFNANKFIGSEERFRIGLEVNNLLGDVREQKFENFESPDKIFTSLRPGTEISFNVSYKF